MLMASLQALGLLSAVENDIGDMMLDGVATASPQDEPSENTASGLPAKRSATRSSSSRCLIDVRSSEPPPHQSASTASPGSTTMPSSARANEDAALGLGSRAIADGKSPRISFRAARTIS